MTSRIAALFQQRALSGSNRVIPGVSLAAATIVAVVLLLACSWRQGPILKLRQQKKRSASPPSRAWSRQHSMWGGSA